jgi:hypothetical protein
MNTSLFRARQMSLALLVIAVVEHGHLNGDYSGANPNSSGLLRLGRDLLRQSSRGAADRPANVKHVEPGQLSAGVRVKA